jgi:hypothetical protein
MRILSYKIFQTKLGQIKMCVNQPQISQWNKIERSIGKAYLERALRNPSFDMNKVHALR